MSDRKAPEQRTATVDVADVRTEGKKLAGYAALYGVESRDLGGFTETIQRGAFSDVLASDPDVYLTFNHSPDKVLARTSSGTLRLADEERGLAFEADLGDGPTAQDVREMVKRGDVSGASFRFVVADEDWQGDRRSVTRIAELIDLSLATTPAYDGPRVELRTKPEATSTPTSGDGRKETNQSMDNETKSEAEDRAADQPEESSSSTPTDSTEAVSTSTGNLKVEDRSAEPEGRSIEDRVSEELRSVNVGETRALSNSSASAISPPELNTFLFQKLRASSVALQSGIGVVQTDKQKVTWPKLSADVAPAFYNEGATITPGDPSFTEITVTPQKIAHITVVSNEVLDDSDPPLFQTLTDHVATTLGLKLDASIYTGGTALPGITGMANLAGRQTGGTVTTSGTAGATSWPAIVSAVGLLRAANAPEPYAMVAGPAVYTALSRLQDTTTQPTQAPASQPVPLPSFHWTTQVSGTAFVYSPSQFQIVSRQDATVELDRSRLFNSDQSEIRGKVRAALLAPNPEAVVTLTAS